MTSGAWDSWATTASAEPDRVAVVDGAHERESFATLVGRGAALADRLLAGGVAPGRAVAVVLGDGARLLESIGGLLALGAVPVVVDEATSADHVHRVVDETDAIAVLHGSPTARLVAGAVKRVQKQWRPRCFEVDTAPGPVLLRDPSTFDAATVVVIAAPPGRHDRPVRVDTSTLRDVAVGAGAHLVLAPLARGPGLVSALTTLSAGHTVVLPPTPWTVDDVLAVVEREHVTRVTVDAAGRDVGHAVAAQFADVGVAVLSTDGIGDAGDDGAARSVFVHGATVDLARVESRVEAHRGVGTCRVAAMATRSGPPALVGIVAPAEGHHLDAAELRAWARRKLAAHETPRAWLLVDSLDPDATDAELRALVIDRLRVP